MKRGKLRAAIEITRQSKKRARALLDAGSNRLWLSLSAVLWMATAGAIYMLGAGLAYAADGSIFTDQPSELAITLSLLSYVLMAVLAIVFLLPMTGGVMQLARLIFEGKRLQAGDLLLAFDSPRQYFRCMGLGLYGLLYPVLTLAVALLGCVAAPSILSGIMRDAGAISVLIWLACAGVAVPGGIAALAVAVAFRSACLRGAFLSRGMPWHEARLRTREIVAKNGLFPFYYRASLLGHVALSVLTIGVSAVVDGIGHALLSHQFACDAFETQEK